MSKQVRKKSEKVSINTTENLNDQAMDAITEMTGAVLNAETKVKVMIPRVEGESDTVECCINGYNYVIKKGVSLDLPKSVVSVLKNSGLV